MMAKPILDKFEVKGIQNISTLENRALIEHRIPGMEGSLFQDLGTEPAQITIRGSLRYNESRQDVLNLEELRKKFKAANAVPFVADITTATNIKEVLIKDIEIKESEELPEYFDYFIELREHVPEPPPSNVQSNVNNEAEERHNNAVQQMAEDTIVIEVEVDAEEVGRVEIQIHNTSGNLVRTVREPTPDGIYIAENLPRDDYSVSKKQI